jgi:uncharacterized protein (TIGR03437 family)
VDRLESPARDLSEISSTFFKRAVPVFVRETGLAGHNVIAVTLFTSKALTTGRILGAMVLVTGFGRAALLSLPSQFANTGQLLASAVTLSTDGSQISGVQFDLAWDQGLDVQIATGSEMRNAVKLIYSAPLATRSMRVLIVGMNQNRIADGELVRLFIVVNLTAGSAQIKLNNPVGVTAAGDLVSIPASSATIQMDATVSGASLLSDGVLNAASLRPGPIAPGEIVTLLGAFGIDANSPGGVVASVNGAPAAVLYALGNQMNIVVPSGLDSGNPADLQLAGPYRQLARITLPTAVASPALFTQSGAGVGPGAILNQDYTPNSPANPAASGSIVMMYGTAFGPLNPRQTGVLSTTALPVSASIAGVPAQVTYAGSAPGLPEGVVQINILVPSAAGTGDALAVSLAAGSISIPDGVTLAVR